MALGRRNPSPPPLLVIAVDLAALKPNPYYDALSKVLAAHEFDPFVEQLCAPLYAGNVGRPGLAPGVYFRCLIIGYLEGLDSERGIAWRCPDSLSLKNFLGFAIDQTPHEGRDAVYANRRRIRGERGKALLRRRGELLERSFAHCPVGEAFGYETGSMRRMHLRKRENIAKRVPSTVPGSTSGC